MESAQRRHLPHQPKHTRLSFNVSMAGSLTVTIQTTSKYKAHSADNEIWASAINIMWQNWQMLTASIARTCATSFPLLVDKKISWGSVTVEVFLAFLPFSNEVL